MSLLLAGLVVRALHWTAGRALWNDEAALALVILERPLRALAGPNEQVAPVGFMFATRAMVAVFGESEIVLRAIPFASGALSLWFFWKLSRRALGRFQAVVALAVLAFSTKPVRYSAELKPYAGDLMLACVIFWLGLKTRHPADRSAVLLLIVGAVGVWWSFPVVIVLASVGATLFFESIVRSESRMDRWGRSTSTRNRLLGLSLAGCVWGLSFAGHYALVGSTRHDAYLLEFWKNEFWTFPPRSVADWAWPVRATLELFTSPFSTGVAVLGFGCFLVGCIRLWKSCKRVAQFILFSLFVAFVLSAARLYPFGERLAFYLVPGMILATTTGVCWPARCRGSSRAMVVGRVMATGLAIALFAGAFVRVISTSLAPEPREEIRPVLRKLAGALRPDDSIYVFSTSRYNWGYYATRCGVHASALVGEQRSPDTDPVFQSLPSTGRVWIVFCHGSINRGVNYRPAFQSRLSETGIRVEVFESPGALVECYTRLNR